MDAKENEKMLKIDEASIEMYEKTKKETFEAMKGKYGKDGKRLHSDEDIEEQVKLIAKSEETVIEDYVSRGGDIDAFLKKFSKPKKKKATKSIDDLIMNSLGEGNKEENVEGTKTNVAVAAPLMDVDIIPDRNENGKNESYDMIPLPSEGECYKEKIGKLPVAYLTAFDENIIASPNIYRDNLLFDTILEQKILNNTINPKDLLEGDREAIILWLRATGYGNEYPVTARDEDTGEDFDAIVDLSKISYKPFKLKADANGWFDYVLPASKHNVKFRFLTHYDNVMLKQIEDEQSKALKRFKLAEISTRLEEYLDDDKELTKNEKVKINEAIRAIDAWNDRLIGEDDNKFTQAVTNRLKASIMSVDNVTDRSFINKFVDSMTVRDSSALRKYIIDNEPGVDWNIEVEKPESLGGGSMKLFLQLDDYVFLNVTQ